MMNTRLLVALCISLVASHSIGQPPIPKTQALRAAEARFATSNISITEAPDGTLVATSDKIDRLELVRNIAAQNLDQDSKKQPLILLYEGSQSSIVSIGYIVEQTAEVQDRPIGAFHNTIEMAWMKIIYAIEPTSLDGDLFLDAKAPQSCQANFSDFDVIRGDSFLSLRDEWLVKGEEKWFLDREFVQTEGVLGVDNVIDLLVRDYGLDEHSLLQVRRSVGSEKISFSHSESLSVREVLVTLLKHHALATGRKEILMQIQPNADSASPVDMILADSSHFPSRIASWSVLSR